MEGGLTFLLHPWGCASCSLGWGCSTNEGGAKITAVEESAVAGTGPADAMEAPTGSLGTVGFDFWG
jgi:hypothetical protein